MDNIQSDQTKFVELSHTIEAGMITYKGLPGPIIYDHLTREESSKFYAEDTEFHIGKIEMVANTGTYIDSPFHRYEQGTDLSRLPLNSIAYLEGVLIRLQYTPGRIITEQELIGIGVQGKAVLIRTGWDQNWGSENYFEGHPYLTQKAAEYLKNSGASLVGIDSFNIDDIHDGHRPAHTILLGANIPIVEHLTSLDQLPDDGFKFFAVPPKIKGLGSFPVRAFAIIE
jgi:kynurenine formamidase